MSTKTFMIVGSICACFACGDDDDDAVAQPDICSPVVPCGGDVVGTWDVQSFCLPQDAAEQALAATLPEACSDAFVSADATPQGLTQQYAADGTLTVTGSANLHNEYLFSEACLTALSPDFPNLEVACQRVIAGNFSGIQFENPDIWELSCVESSGACDCDAVASVDLGSSGSYTTGGNEILSGTTSAPYCVAGTQLTVATPELGGDAIARRR